MLILGIESSCDETGAAIIEGKSNSKKIKLLSNVVASSLPLHAKSGGIIPENAAREQIKFIIPVIKETLLKARLKMKDIDSIAVTYGPGLIGSLLIGVETAKTLSYIYNIPLIPTNHLLGHIYANWLVADSESRMGKNQLATSNAPQADIQFPAIALIVSGGHTDLSIVNKHGSIKWLGGTRDDAAGEAFDKIGRLLGLPYPGGPHIEKLASKGNPNKYKFPSPLISSNDFDFSFSGLKTAVLRQVQAMQPLNHSAICDLSASVQKAIVDVLVKKTLKAAEQYNAKSILLGGGVAANQSLHDELKLNAKRYSLNAEIFVPQKFLCTDNAAMISAAAFFNNQTIPWQKVDADPGLYFDQA